MSDVLRRLGLRRLAVRPRHPGLDADDDILDAGSSAWNWLTSQPRRITTVASRRWAQANQ